MCHIFTSYVKLPEAKFGKSWQIPPAAAPAAPMQAFPQRRNSSPMSADHVVSNGETLGMTIPKRVFSGFFR